LSRQEAAVSQLRRFIERAQASLQDVVNLDKVDSWLAYPLQRDRAIEEHSCRMAQVLERRVCALWSCLVAATLADVFRCQMYDRTVSSAFAVENESYLEPLLAYAVEALQVTPTLVSLGSRFSCMCAIEGSRVVTQIIEVGSLWEGSTLNESPNDYVDELSERCSLLWGYLSISGKLPLPLLNPLWEQLLSAAYLSLLEGFARVPFCSTEGRALMTLDLASLSAGTAPDSVMATLAKCFLETQRPPLVDASRLMEYVGMYIKVFYFPVDDVLDWIKANYADYHVNHSVALMVATAGPNAETRVLVDRVKDHYSYNNDTDKRAVS
jgi:hypothetical protein